MISIQNITKQYANQVIFNNITFNINSGERVGLVGRNGHGKTTLFRLIEGEDECDSGTISIPKDYKIGYLTQHIKFTMPTVIEEGCLGLPDDKKSEQWKVEKILSGLGFSENDMRRGPMEFSGGYQIRLNLAKVLAAGPNMLLLDEPTNFLDIVSIRWLVNFLNSWKGEALLISHDRMFMDKVVTHIVGIHRCKAKKIAGQTQKYYDQIDKEEDVYEKERLNEEKKRKQTEKFIAQFRAKARQASLAQSRIKTLAKQERKEKLESIADFSFSFNHAPCPGKYVQEARDISFSYNGKPPFLLDLLEFTVEKDDKICVAGKNGKGKTTLLKLLASRLQPVEGEIKSHPQAKIAYFEQTNTAYLGDDKSVEEEIMSAGQNIDRKRARDVCGAMMFSGDLALKKIASLSGGEKCRVLLGKLLLKPANLLMLDEPTRHLDMQSCDTIADAIKSFPGAAIIVTHNEYILHKIATKMIIFSKGNVFLFRGTYEEFLDQVGWEDEENPATNNKNKAKKRGDGKKSSRKTRAEFYAWRSKTLSPFKKKIESLEKTIEKIELDLYGNTQAMIKASENQDAAAIAKLGKEQKELRNCIDDLYDCLEETTIEFEKESVCFELEDREFLNEK